MKKVYIQPSLEAYNVNNEAILAGSPEMNVDPSQSSGTMDAKQIFDDFDSEEEI